jgi:hypothetical protein
MVPMILRKMYLLFPLKGDERNIGGHKKRDIRELLEKKNITVPIR